MYIKKIIPIRPVIFLEKGACKRDIPCFTVFSHPYICLFYLHAVIVTAFLKINLKMEVNECVKKKTGKFSGHPASLTLESSKKASWRKSIFPKNKKKIGREKGMNKPEGQRVVAYI